MNFFTVDVEEYFQVAALAPYAPRPQWPTFPRRVDVGIDRLLELLNRFKSTATFFVLGTVAEWNPDVVRRIAAAGHEVASHGWSHRSVTALSRDDFRCEVVRSKQLLSELAGHTVIGFRAPNFSIHREQAWAFDILSEAGYSYDSSIFPGRGSGNDFSVDDVGRLACQSELLEVPMTSASFGRFRLPAAGGAWFRLLPYALTRRALNQASERGTAGVFYIHPWELDPDQPVLEADVQTRLRHYGGLARVQGRLERLLAEFRFSSIASGLPSFDRKAQNRPLAANS